MLSRFAILMLLLPVIAGAESNFCLVQYKSDFAFADTDYSVDTAAGLTAEVKWGPHGYVGAILLPQKGQRDRVPLERFETFYRSFNCQWESIQDLWDYSFANIASRKNCTALVSGSREAVFVCEGRPNSYRLGEDALGPFQRYELKGSGPWYQSEEYFEAKKLLQKLEEAAVTDVHDSVTAARSLTKCESDLRPEEIELPDLTSPLIAKPRVSVAATISFTVGTDGSVSEILLGQTAAYEFEYLLAHSARDSRYSPRDKPCRREWVYAFAAR